MRKSLIEKVIYLEIYRKFMFQTFFRQLINVPRMHPYSKLQKISFPSYPFLACYVYIKNKTRNKNWKIQILLTCIIIRCILTKKLCINKLEFNLNLLLKIFWAIFNVNEISSSSTYSQIFCRWEKGHWDIHNWNGDNCIRWLLKRLWPNINIYLKSNQIN